ncbi:MAG TPA: MFS transporter, partial [bacterium]|nr:MFS transporter [bacterium]
MTAVVPRWRRELDPVGAVYFWFFLCMGSLSPFIYVYYQRIGLGAGDIKLLATLSPLVCLLTQPLWGALADLLHARRAILAICLAGNALACLAYLTTNELVPLLGVVTLYALFQGAVLPLVNSCAIAAGGQETGFGTRRL